MADFPYPGKFTFVDVEIPNLNNDCICAISMIVIDEGEEKLRVTELINPRTFFSANNIKIHHIHRKDVLNSRTLPQFWADYGQYFEEPYIIGAHNAMSDISVINKDLARIHTEIHATKYVDTMDIMDQFYYRGNQGKGDLKLCNIAEHLGIELDHHNPQSDVNACYEIIRYMYNHFEMDLEPFIKNIKKTKFRPKKHTAVPSSRQMKIFLNYVRKQITRKSPSVDISVLKAKKQGDAAYEEGDYEGVIFNYEVAAAKNWQSASVYLRLAEIYDSLNMTFDANRILEKGIRNLKRTNRDWRILKSMAYNLNRKRRKPESQEAEKQKEASSRKKGSKKYPELAGKKADAANDISKTSENTAETITDQSSSAAGGVETGAESQNPDASQPAPARQSKAVKADASKKKRIRRGNISRRTRKPKKPNPAPAASKSESVSQSAAPKAEGSNPSQPASAPTKVQSAELVH